jgi:DNA-binding NarL/FixJ family response regulator
MIRLVMADDHAIVRGGLKQIFAQTTDIEVAGEAVNGGEVMEWLAKGGFDLLLLDLNMPGVSGPELIARVKAQQADLPILVLSMHNEPRVAARVLKSGANGYITKDSDPDVLLSAIRKVAGGGKFIAPELAEKMVFDGSSPEQRLPHSNLSDRELDVFRLLIAGKSVNDIADELCISNKTVSTHKAHLMEKLDISSTAALMQYAMQHGFLG